MPHSPDKLIEDIRLAVSWDVVENKLSILIDDINAIAL
jgi:hypothetical protein